MSDPASNDLSAKLENTYFSIHSGRQGFTDQLMQFSAFYKLGLALGMQYLHSPFDSSRSKAVSEDARAGFDVYDFLGINPYFANNTLVPQTMDDASSQNEASTQSVLTQYILGNRKKSFEAINIYFSDAIIDAADVRSLDDLLAYTHNAITEHARENALFILRLDPAPPPQGKTKRQFFSIIHQAIPNFQNGLSLRKLFEKSQQERNNNQCLASSEHENEASQHILIHIRQGDTAYIETPWNTFIPVDKRRDDYLKQVKDYKTMINAYTSNMVTALFEPEDYLAFLQRLVYELNLTSVSSTCFSDGYERAFQIIENNWHRVPVLARIKEKRLVKLQKHMPKYNARKFAIFEGLQNHTNVIGETHEALKQLIYCALKADILLVAAQQRMLPKLLAIYGMQPQQILIILYRSSKPDYSDILSKRDKDKFVFINIDEPDFTAIRSVL